MINLALNMRQVQTDLPDLCNKQDSEYLEGMLRITKQDAEVESSQIAEPSNLVSEFRGCFADKPEIISLVEHYVELTTDIPIRSTAYGVSARQRKIVDREIKAILEMGVIVPTESE